MKPRTIFVLVLFLAAVILVIYRLADWPRKFEYTFYPMGAIPCKVTLYDAKLKAEESAFEAIQDEVSDLENVFSVHRRHSEASKLNGAKADEWRSVSKDMYDILEKSLTWYGMTGGAFDVTVGPLIKLWSAAERDKKPPTPDEISAVLERVGSSYVTLSPEKGVEFLRDGMEMDFGGIAKGYILDRVGKFLESRSIEKYVVSCGGDVIMRGKDNFRVGVQEPGGTEADLMMVLNIPAGSVVTSGHYERFYEIGGRKYSHIIDPATGLPADSDLASVTIMTDINGTTADADALATAVAVLGFDKSVEFIKKSDQYKAVLLRKAGDGYEIHYSKLLAGKIEFVDQWADTPRVEF